MDTQIKNYSFNKTNKTIVFNDYTIIREDSLRLITNTTDGIVIYNFADPLKGGTVLGNVLTLEYDTSSMANTDNLQIIYNTDELHASQEKQDEALMTLHLLKRMVKLLESNGVVDIQGRQRVQLDQTVSIIPSYNAIANVPTSGGPSLNNLNWVYYLPTWSGPVDPRWTNIQNARLAYNTGIRSKLINS